MHSHEDKEHTPMTFGEWCFYAVFSALCIAGGYLLRSGPRQTLEDVVWLLREAYGLFTNIMRMTS